VIFSCSSFASSWSLTTFSSEDISLADLHKLLDLVDTDSLPLFNQNLYLIIRRSICHVSEFVKFVCTGAWLTSGQTGVAYGGQTDGLPDGWAAMGVAYGGRRTGEIIFLNQQLIFQDFSRTTFIFKHFQSLEFAAF